MGSEKKQRMPGEGCENCGQHNYDGTCSKIPGEYYGYSSEIGDGFWCESYKKITPEAVERMRRDHG